jgi:transcriptional regulator with XRE-family HTH domain
MMKSITFEVIMRRNMMNSIPFQSSIGQSLQYWRKLKKISQLDLALEANISARHLSFIETGKSQPSRETVTRLASALKLSLKQQNGLFVSAGYSPVYPSTNLDAPKMIPVRQAVERMLKQHEPFPAVATTRNYDILLPNHGYENLVTRFAGASALMKYPNVYKLVFAKEGLSQYIKNWSLVGLLLLRRLHDEMFASRDESLSLLYQEVLQNAPVAPDMKAFNSFNEDVPVLGFSLAKGLVCMSFFSMITTFGTPHDVIAQELRIEFLFPADSQTEKYWEV